MTIGRSFARNSANIEMPNRLRKTMRLQ